MWVFTKGGRFVSAVADRNNTKLLHVRARNADDLTTLAKRAGKDIVHTTASDYAYRVICDKPTFKGWMLSQIDGIDYDNFKDTIPKQDGMRKVALMEVWRAMSKLQPNAPWSGRMREHVAIRPPSERRHKLTDRRTLTLAEAETLMGLDPDYEHDRLFDEPESWELDHDTGEVIDHHA